MGRSSFSPGQAFLQGVRRGLRDHIRNTGEVPSLMCAVSSGGSPRVVHFRMRLDLLEDQLAVKALVQGEVRAHASQYAAFGGLTRARDRFALVVVARADAQVWSAPVSAKTGLGGWIRDATVDVPGGWDFVQSAIEEARTDG